MKYDVQFTNQFKKDLKLAKKQRKNLDELFEVIDILANGRTLDAKYRGCDRDYRFDSMYFYQCKYVLLYNYS